MPYPNGMGPQPRERGGSGLGLVRMRPNQDGVSVQTVCEPSRYKGRPRAATRSSPAPRTRKSGPRRTFVQLPGTPRRQGIMGITGTPQPRYEWGVGVIGSTRLAATEVPARAVGSR